MTTPNGTPEVTLTDVARELGALRAEVQRLRLAVSPQALRDDRLTRTQVAELLGCSERTVAKFVSRGVLPRGEMRSGCRMWSPRDVQDARRRMAQSDRRGGPRRA